MRKTYLVSLISFKAFPHYKIHTAETEQMRFLETVLPYVASKKVEGGLSAEEINQLHQKLMEAAKQHGKTG